jgi:putative membrane protein
MVTIAALAACASSPAATPAAGTTGTAAGRRNAADTARSSGGQSTAMERGVGQTVPGDPSAGRAADSSATAAVSGAAASNTFTDAGRGLAATATSDAQIVGLLHQSNLSEIAAGQLAQQRAQSADVKTFAQQMVTEHTQLDTRGSTLASQAGITPTLPDSTLPRGDAEAMTTLQGAGGGAAFDRAYVAQQIGAHQRTLALVEASIGKAQNAQLKAMLQNEVRPKVAAHLQQAQTLQRTVGTAP